MYLYIIDNYVDYVALCVLSRQTSSIYCTWEYLQVRWQRLFVNATMEFLQAKGLIESESLVDSKRTGNRGKSEKKFALMC